MRASKSMVFRKIRDLFAKDFYMNFNNLIIHFQFLFNFFSRNIEKIRDLFSKDFYMILTICTLPFQFLNHSKKIEKN